MGNGTNQTGSIYVESTPSGASIQLFYEGTEEKITETTPHTITGKKPGKYKVIVSFAGDTKAKEVTVVAGETVTIKSTIYTPEIRKQIHLIGYYTLFLMAILIVIAIATHLNYITLDDFMKMIIYIACSGGLGALAFNMYVYVYHIGRAEDFQLEYTLSYLLRPYLGIIYGTFVFFLVAGGLMILSGTSATPLDENLLTTKSIMFYCALAFLAGYAEEPFSLELKCLAEALFKEP